MATSTFTQLLNSAGGSAVKRSDVRLGGETEEKGGGGQETKT